MTKQQQQCK